MPLFKIKKTDAEKAQAHMLKELARVAKEQRKFAAQQHKAQQARAKQAAKESKRQQKEAHKQQKEAHKSRQKAVQVAKQASRTRIRMARKADKQRARRHKRQQRRARALAQQDAALVDAGVVVPPPFTKSSGCYVCGKKFGSALHLRRHHCRQCRESCCLQCTSRTRRAVPLFGLQKPQKVCVVCDTLVFANEQATQPREPAEAVAALAASGRARRPHSAPLPPTEAVATPGTTRVRVRARSSKRGSIWTLPIRPLLKRKKSAEQLRNRKLDQDLQLEKRVLLGGRAIELQPQTAP
ncbi:hypothetical protein PRIC1_004978 [Phytophthora ramorum]